MQPETVTFAEVKTKPTYNKITRIVVIILCSVVGLAGIFLVYLVVHPISALNVPKSIGIRTVYGGEATADQEEKLWFDSIEQAMEGSDLSECVFISEPLLTFESDSEVSNLYFIELKNGRSEFIVFRFDKQGEQFSSATKTPFASTDLSKLLDGKFLYETEDLKAAEHLTDRMSDNLVGAPPSCFQYFGVSEDPSVLTLTVLGREPTDIIEYEYEGVTYYFWYFDKADFAQYLLDHPDFDFGDFTLARVIKVLEIKVDGSS
jgi:hypothetical protein